MGTSNETNMHRRARALQRSEGITYQQARARLTTAPDTRRRPPEPVTELVNSTYHVVIVDDIGYTTDTFGWDDLPPAIREQLISAPDSTVETALEAGTWTVTRHGQRVDDTREHDGRTSRNDLCDVCRDDSHPVCPLDQHCTCCRSTLTQLADGD